MPTNKEVDAFMRKVEPEWRCWCWEMYKPGGCDCEGCVNGEAHFPWSRIYFQWWVVRSWFSYIEATDAEVDLFMNRMYPEYRYTWFEGDNSGDDYCKCANGENDYYDISSEPFPWPKKYWKAWVKRHPKPDMKSANKEWLRTHKSGHCAPHHWGMEKSTKRRVVKKGHPTKRNYRDLSESKPVFMKVKTDV